MQSYPSYKDNPILQSPLVQQVVPDINTRVDQIYKMVEQLQGQVVTQPTVQSKAQEEFYKSKPYLYKLQEYFTGYMLGKFGAEFKNSENYRIFEKWANDEFKKFEENFSK